MCSSDLSTTAQLPQNPLTLLPFFACLFHRFESAAELIVSPRPVVHAVLFVGSGALVPTSMLKVRFRKSVMRLQLG